MMEREPTHPRLPCGSEELSGGDDGTTAEILRFRAELLAGVDRIAASGGVENYFDTPPDEPPA